MNNLGYEWKDQEQVCQSSNESYSESQPQNDLTQTESDRKTVEDLWATALSSATPQYKKRLTRKQLTKLLEANKATPSTFATRETFATTSKRCAAF